MRWVITFLILAIVVGVLLPYVLGDRFVGMGIELPTLRGSASATPEYRISGEAVLRFLRIAGIGFCIAAVLCFASSRRTADPVVSQPEATNEK